VSDRRRSRVRSRSRPSFRAATSAGLVGRGRRSPGAPAAGNAHSGSCPCAAGRPDRATHNDLLAPGSGVPAARGLPASAPSRRSSARSRSRPRPAADPNPSRGGRHRSALAARPRADARRAKRAARAIPQTRPRPTRLLTSLQPAMPPTMRSRRRDVESGRSRPQRQTVLDRPHQREPTSQSELGVTVQQHSSPPSRVSLGRPTHSKEGRIEPSAVHNLCRQDI
jgi:hypothetical protein